MQASTAESLHRHSQIAWSALTLLYGGLWLVTVGWIGPVLAFFAWTPLALPVAALTRLRLAKLQAAPSRAWTVAVAAIWAVLVVAAWDGGERYLPESLFWVTTGCITLFPPILALAAVRATARAAGSAPALEDKA
jgi:hypothetical protein